MLFRKQIKSVPDVRTKIGKVIRVDNGALDVMTVGGSAPIKGIRCAGNAPAVNDWVMISFYKNNEIIATPIAAQDNSSGTGNTTIISTSPSVVQSTTSFLPGLGLATDGSGYTNVQIVSGRTQISSNRVDVSTLLLPTPAERGHFLVSNASGGSTWSKRIYMPDDDTVWIQNSSLLPVIILDGSANSYFALPISLGTSGGIWQGTGTFASPTTGIKIWNDTGVGRIAGYSAGTIQWYTNTDGKLYAGAGDVVIGDGGITLATPSSFRSSSSYKFVSDGTLGVWGKLVTVGPNTTESLNITSEPGSGKHSSVALNSTAVTGKNTTVLISSVRDSVTYSLSISASNTKNLFTGALEIDTSVTAEAFSIKLTTNKGSTSLLPTAESSINISLPLSAGTLALTSDITTAVNAAVSGTTSKIAKFTAANVVGNSIMTESGAKIQVAGAVEITGQADTNQLVVQSHSTQTAGQILIQSSASAELTRLYVNAAGAIALGYQAGNALGAVGETVAIGYQAGLVTTDNGGVYIGYKAGKAVTANGLTGQTNVAIGSGSLQTNTTGYGNVAIGWESMKVYTGKQSIAIGDRTMWKASTGLYNFAFGEEALFNLTSGSANEAIGIQALYSNNGSNNIGVGAWALYSNASGSDNVVFGANAGFHNLGSSNVYIGTSVGYNATGDNSVFIGYEAGRLSGSATVTGSIYIGYRSGYGALAGAGNTAVGHQAGQKTVAGLTAFGYEAGKAATGAGNVLVGYQAGLTVSSGTNNAILGYQAGASLTTNGGCVMIGYQAGGNETAANKLYIHNSNSTTPLIYGDFSTPSLTFNGTVNIQDAKNIVLGTTTGTQLGSGATQKLALWGATPIVQPTTGVAAATFVANAGTAVNDASTFDGYTLNQVVKALRNTGLLA